MKEKIPSLVEQHFAALQRRLNLAVAENDFGAIIRDERSEVVDEFLESVGFADFVGINEVENLVFTSFNSLESERLQMGFDPNSLPDDGFEFEYWVADAFKKFGWNAVVTSASGDQGIDVIIEKSGVRIGVQAKLFSKPVGNSAVQEAFAGQKFHNLDASCVLSSNTFTKSAKQLSASNGVVLMSHYDIPKADELFL